MIDRKIVSTIALLALCNGCADLPKSLADRKAEFVQRQSDYMVKNERVTQYVNLSGDRYDSFRTITISNPSGIGISVPVGSDGAGAFVTHGGARALPISFTCDYLRGLTQGEIVLSYQDPKNLYGRIYGVVAVSCVPLRDDEIAGQMAAQKEKHRIAEERLEAEKSAKQIRLTEQKAKEDKAREEEKKRLATEAADRVAKNSPKFKREEAERTIRRLRANAAETHEKMEEERQVGRVSGFVNSRRMYELGANIVAIEKEAARQFLIYRNNGGVVKTVTEIR